MKREEIKSRLEFSAGAGKWLYENAVKGTAISSLRIYISNDGYVSAECKVGGDPCNYEVTHFGTREHPERFYVREPANIPTVCPDGIEDDLPFT